jgi:nucleoid-associated protein YgaU
VSLPPVRPEPSGFTPTPIYPAGPGRVETTAPPVDDRAVLGPVRAGSIEAGPVGGAVRPAVAGTPAAPAGLLVRKADGKDYYTVQPGDKGYWGIAAKTGIYGEGSKWDLIQKANPGVDPSRLRPGQELVIPPAPAAAGPTTRPVALTSTTRPANSTSYKVKQGDTLETIARAQYGNGALWSEIAKANPGVEPNRLRIGQELVLPSAEDARRAAGLPAAGTTTPTTRPALARTSSPTPSAVRSPTSPPARVPGGWD